MVKHVPANEEDTGDAGLIPELARSPGVGTDNWLQYSCLEIPRTEEPGGFMGSQRIRHDWATEYAWSAVARGI